MSNRKTLTIALMLLCSMLAWGQQSKIVTNWDTHYSQGIRLSREGYYAVSCTYLERFVVSARQKVQECAKETGSGYVDFAPAAVNSMIEEAEYWLCYNHYMMKDKEAIDRINAHLARYPESAMRGQLMYMRGRWYYEKRKWQEAVDAYAQCDAKVLNYDDREVFVFSQAYSQLQLKQYEKASRGFKESMTTSRNYYNEAAYYYAYAEFCMEHSTLPSTSSTALTTTRSTRRLQSSTSCKSMTRRVSALRLSRRARTLSATTLRASMQQRLTASSARMPTALRTTRRLPMPYTTTPARARILTARTSTCRVSRST